MPIETHQSPQAPGHGDYERRDIGVAGVVYFFLGLAAATMIIHFVLVGLYDFLDKRAKAHEPALSPLVTNVPTDARHVAKDYPKQAFPDPRLETDERGQLNDERLREEQLLNSYGWIDEKSKTARIPIDRAMDLIAQRGLPVRPQTTAQPQVSKSQKGRKK
jgi:hypothetical protein